MVAKLLESLMDTPMSDIDRQPSNPLQIAANWHVLFRKMTGDDVDLSGINPQNLMAEPPLLKADLGLLWRLIQKYELPHEAGKSDTDSLLAWVLPKTKQLGEKYVMVKPAGTHAPANGKIKDFAGDWCDGMAFLTLLDDIVPGTVNWEAVPASKEARLSQAFKSFLETMGVPMLLEPEVRARVRVRVKARVTLRVKRVRGLEGQCVEG